jgi:hypothetical protein
MLICNLKKKYFYPHQVCKHEQQQQQQNTRNASGNTSSNCLQALREHGKVAPQATLVPDVSSLSTGGRKEAS